MERNFQPKQVNIDRHVMQKIEEVIDNAKQI